MRPHVASVLLAGLIAGSCPYAVTAQTKSSPPPTQKPEHPEHPANSKAEHPEHPADKKGEQAAQPVTLDRLAAAIEKYIQDDSKLKGGFFLVYDTVDRKPLQLRLQKVHRDKLAGLGEDVYFACTDLQDVGGVVYDLDFFMQGDSG